VPIVSGCGKFIATFAPQRTDDLRYDAGRWIGWRGVWRYLWTVDEEDGGPYVGQKVFEPVGVRYSWFGCVPECDLEDIEVLEPLMEA